jgi:hypothetical protein
MTTRLKVSLFASAILTVAIAAIVIQAQNTAKPAANIPRMAGGRPNLTGLWQAMGTAYWDIRDHSAQAGPFYQLGAIGAMPAGVGIVEGGDIPYRPEAAAKQR